METLEDLHSNYRQIEKAIRYIDDNFKEQFSKA